MITDHLCPICDDAQQAKGTSAWPITPAAGAVFVRLTTEPVAKVKCANGHESALVILDGAYALIFERSLQRLVTGHTRDAIIDAHTAFEMYMAHVPARVRYDREQGASPRVLRDQLKTATHTSDRALAAGLTALSVATGSAPPRPPEKASSLRNSAAHTGVYPKENDTEQACLEIYRFITEIDRRLDALPCVNPTDYWDASLAEEVDECFERHKLSNLPVVRRAMALCLSENRGRNRCTVPIEETIASYRRDVDLGHYGWSVW